MRIKSAIVAVSASIAFFRRGLPAGAAIPTAQPVSAAPELKIVPVIFAAAPGADNIYTPELTAPNGTATFSPGSSSSSAITVTPLGNGDYIPGFAHVVAAGGATEGYFATSGFIPTDPELFAVRILVNGEGPTTAQVAQIVSDLNYLAGPDSQASVVSGSLDTFLGGEYDFLDTELPSIFRKRTELCWIRLRIRNSRRRRHVDGYRGIFGRARAGRAFIDNRGTRYSSEAASAHLSFRPGRLSLGSAGRFLSSIIFVRDFSDGGPAGVQVQCFPVAENLGPGYASVWIHGVPNLDYLPGTTTNSSEFELFAPSTVVIPAQVAGSGLRTLQLGIVQVDSGADLQVATAPAYDDRSVVVFNNSLFIQLPGGTLDLGGNDAIVSNANSGTFTYLQYLLTSGFAGGAWNGFGLASSAAAADTTHGTALRNIINSLTGILAPGGTALLTTFDGFSVGSGDILLGYTFYGDATFAGYAGQNPAGSVGFGDLTQVLVHYGLTGQTWGNGNFFYNVSSAVNFSDLSQVLGHFNLTMGS